MHRAHAPNFIYVNKPQSKSTHPHYTASSPVGPDNTWRERQRTRQPENQFVSSVPPRPPVPAQQVNNSDGNEDNDDGNSQPNKKHRTSQLAIPTPKQHGNGSGARHARSTLNLAKIPQVPSTCKFPPWIVNNKDYRDGGTGGACAGVAQTNGGDEEDDSQHFKRMTKLHSFPFDDAGPRCSSNKLKMDFAPAVALEPTVCFKVFHLPKQPKRPTDGTIGPNDDWKVITQQFRPSRRGRRIRRAPRHPQPPREEQQFVLNDSRYDGDDSSRVNCQPTRLRDRLVLTVVQLTKRRQSGPIKVDPNTQVSSVQEDDAFPFTDKPELPSPVSSLSTEDQSTNETERSIPAVDGIENSDVGQTVNPIELPHCSIAAMARSKDKSRRNCSQKACEDAVPGQKRKRGDV